MEPYYRNRFNSWRAMGSFMFLEDNLRCPSGVSYMLENREILKRTFPELFEKLHVRPVYNYSHYLRDMLESLSNVSPVSYCCFNTRNL